MQPGTLLSGQDYYRKAYRFFRPDPVFAPWIDYFWESSFENLSAPEWDSLREISQATLSSSIVLNLGAPFYLQLQEKEKIALPEAVFIGHHEIPLHFEHHTANRLIGVKLREAGIFALLGLPAKAFLNQWVPLREMMNVRNWEQNPRLFLENRLYHEPEKGRNWFQYEAVNAAMQEFRKFGFKADLDQLAQGQHLTVKSLYRYFWTVLGISPRKALSILRLNEAIKARESDPDGFSIYDFGYYDHSHFLKELKQFKG